MSLTPKEMLQKIKGPLALLPTHFNKDESLDLGAMRATAEFVLKSMEGKDGCVMIAGSTSEFYAMTDKESLDMIDAVVDVIKGKVPLIAGTGRAATGLTIDMSMKAQDAGVDLAMVSNPYYLMITDEGLYRHFSKVAEALDIGVMIYDNPTTSKMNVPVDIMKRLSKIPNIIATKENSIDMDKIYWLTHETDSSEFIVTCGIGTNYYMYEAMLGVHAFVTDLMCIAPNLAYKMYDADCAKEYVAMKQVLDQIVPYNKFIAKCVSSRRIPTSIELAHGGRATSVYQSVMKKAMELVDLPGGVVREPLENLTNTEVADLRRALLDSGIPVVK